MGIPREYYNIEDLAKHWKHFEITVSDIEHFLETGKLLAEFKDTAEHFIRPGNSLYYMRDLNRLIPNNFKKSIYVSEDSYLFGEINISYEEVERYENKYFNSQNSVLTLDGHLEGNTKITENAAFQETPEEYVKYLRSQNKKDPEIAVLLKNKYNNLNGHKCMEIIDPKRVQDWEKSDAQQGRPKQWFYVLKKQGREILANQDKMTSS